MKRKTGLPPQTGAKRVVVARRLGLQYPSSTGRLRFQKNMTVSISIMTHLTELSDGTTVRRPVRQADCCRIPDGQA
jgi:hypothetical protein